MIFPPVNELRVQKINRILEANYRETQSLQFLQAKPDDAWKNIWAYIVMRKFITAMEDLVTEASKASQIGGKSNNQ